MVPPLPKTLPSQASALKSPGISLSRDGNLFPKGVRGMGCCQADRQFYIQGRLAHTPPSVSEGDPTRTLAYIFPERAIVMLSSFLVNIPKHTYPTFKSCINVLPSSDVAMGRNGPAANVHVPAAETAALLS